MEDKVKTTESEQTQLTPWEKIKSKYPEFIGIYWTYKDIATYTKYSVSSIRKLRREDPNFPKPLDAPINKKLWRALDVLAYVESFSKD